MPVLHMRLFNTAPVYPSALNDTLLLSEPLPHSARSYRDHVETLRASITHRLCSAWNDQGMAQVEVPFTRCLFEAKTIFRTQTLIHHLSGYKLNTPLRSVVSTRCCFHCRFGSMFTWKEQREEPTDVWWAPSKLQFQVDAVRHVGLDLVQGSLASNRPDRHEAVEGPRRRRRWNASLLFKFTG